MEVLIEAEVDVFLRHARRKALAFFLVEEVEVVLQPEIEVVKSAVGGGDEVVEFDELQEGSDLMETARVLLVEDDKQSKDETAKEAKASRTAEEGDEIGVKVVSKDTALPVAESGARNSVLLGVLALRERRMGRIG
jgi:hypothetical protein